MTTPYVAKITSRQLTQIKNAGLRVKLHVCVQRICTNDPLAVETLHGIAGDSDWTPSFVNGDFRIYLAMTEQ